MEQRVLKVRSSWRFFRPGLCGLRRHWWHWKSRQWPVPAMQSMGEPFFDNGCASFRKWTQEGNNSPRAGSKFPVRIYRFALCKTSVSRSWFESRKSEPRRKHMSEPTLTLRQLFEVNPDDLSVRAESSFDLDQDV